MPSMTPAQLPADSGINDLRLARRITLLRHGVLVTMVLLVLALILFVLMCGRNAYVIGAQTIPAARVQTTAAESFRRFVVLSALAVAVAIPQASFLMLAWTV